MLKGCLHASRQQRDVWECLTGPKMIGVGGDGASVNMGAGRGLKGLLTATMPWVVAYYID